MIVVSGIEMESISRYVGKESRCHDASQIVYAPCRIEAKKGGL